MINLINSFLQLFNLKIVSRFQTVNGLNYISARETVQNAKNAGLSVCDYVEKMWEQQGETQKVIDNLEKYDVFKITNSKICEIGAGTGRYMEKVLEKCQPVKYESYETATDWAEWLQEQYPIISQPTDGFSLSSTKDNSMDLIHAHGVFVYLNFLDNVRYFNDMVKKTKINGYLVFDCYTEDCMTKDILEKWLASKHNYPSILPNDYVINYFENRSFKLLGTFFNAHGQGKSKYFIFKKLN